MDKIRLSRALWIVAFAIGSFGPRPAAARVRYYLDMDGTQVFFRTPWVLRRIDKLRNMLQPDPRALDLPEWIEVTEDEYRANAVHFGKGDAKIGSLGSLRLASDPFLKRPETIVPGYYAIDPAATFKEFRPGGGEAGYLKRHLDQAESREKLGVLNDDGTPYRWEGPALPLVAHALGSKDTVQNLVTASARWLGDGHYEKYLRGLQKLGVARHIKDREGRIPRWVSLGAPEALLLGRGDLGQLKVNGMRAEARDQLMTMTEPHLELAAAPGLAARGSKLPVDTLIVAENEARYVEPMRRALEALSNEYLFNARMKFVLLNAGRGRDLEDLRYPWAWTVFYRGIGRPAMAEEIAFWTGTGCAGAIK